MGKGIFVYPANTELYVGQLVLLVDELAPRDQWRVGRVEALGDDGCKSRKAMVKLANGKVFERHVTKLIALEMDA